VNTALSAAHAAGSAFVASRVKALLTAEEITRLQEIRARHLPGERTIYSGHQYAEDPHLVAKIDELLA
jgi:hypothetical protein